MGQAIGEVLVFGIGVALSPLAIVAVAVMIGTREDAAPRMRTGQKGRVAGTRMASSVSKVWARGKAIPWAVVWEVARSLWLNARDRVSSNLSPREREDFAAIVRKGRGRPWNLDERERGRLAALVKKASTGDSESSWNEVGTSLVTLFPPRLLNEAWKRRPGRR